MVYTKHYMSPLGGIILAADDEGLIGLWFDGQKYFGTNLPKEYEEKETPVLFEAERWRNIYFSKKRPDFTPPLHMTGSEFRLAVWKELLKIPYGKTVTYGEIARALGAERGFKKMSAQAVGGAVGHSLLYKGILTLLKEYCKCFLIQFDFNSHSNRRSAEFLSYEKRMPPSLSNV